MTLATSFSQLILAKRVQQKLKTNPNDVYLWSCWQV
jgi:hypothetical protein